MGGLFSKQKKDGGKKFYQFWSKEQQQPEPNLTPVTSLSTPKLPTSEWTDVPLQVPDLPDNVKKINVEIPIPPPRKHRGKSQSMKSTVVETNTSKEIKPPRALPKTPIPVEEPIIVPKKEPIHICDGTHHHVTNIANGKVIQSGRVSPKSKHVAMAKLDKSMRPKNVSTVSLPNYEELSVKKNSRHDNSREVNPKKKPKRHISVTSLPTENKVFLSNTTAARLENYMMRCKSFGSLPPKELLDKLKHDLEYGTESDDSFEGLDAWDMEVFEHNAIRSSPLVPRCRLNAPTPVPAVVTPDNRLPTTIEEVDEVLKNKVPLTPKAIITLKKREGRRESIDDFFDAKAENPITSKLLSIKHENYLGRRGSDGFFGYDKRCYPFKNAENDPSFQSDTFFSNALLQSESEKSKQDQLKQRRKSAGAALHRVESYDDDDDDDRLKTPVKMADIDDDLLNTFQKFYKKENKVDDDVNVTTVDIPSKIDSVKEISSDTPATLKSAIEAHSPTLTNNFNLEETNKPKVEHSGLLRFIQENTLDDTEKSTSHASDKIKITVEDTFPSLEKRTDDKERKSNSNTESLSMMVPM